ncbi:MAG: Serine/threonine-protein kinase pkn3 [Myxococcaceae bacterium]|nr:Serine/threonine-protein kinase pkn3 [Myxococcaceae bacterium]
MEVAYASARDRIGQTLCGKYFIDEVLGVGGTAVVFRATHRNGNRVAVKLLHDHLCKSRDITRRFMREAYLANLLEHPGTVRVLDDDVDQNGVAFLVLELLEGETLEERRVRLGGRLAVDEVLGYMDRLLEVLELAHEKNIVHRDIKPSNLFLTKDGVLKVLDFGIARMLDEHGAATATKTGQMIGTPAFMPPEQALSKPKEIDKQTDLWAVGATIFTLLSGELVHVAESSSEHLVKAATMHARSVARVLPGVPANVETLVGRALRFDKKERWGSATEMRRELWRVRLDPGRPIGTTSAPPPRNPSSNFPTLVGKRDSDKSALRETGMSLTGEVRFDGIRDPASRRAVFFSTVVAILLVASALTFGIYMTIGSKAQLARPAAAAAGEKTSPPLPADMLPSETLPPAAVTLPLGDMAANAGAKPAATGIPGDGARGTSGATASVTAPSATTKATASPLAAPTTPKSNGATAKRGPAPASTGDLYKPF